MASLSVDSVAFTGVLKNYPPGEKLEVAYTLIEVLIPASRDWVGLFQVGWSSSRDYYTFEWAPAPTDRKGSVVFAGRRLPPQDKHFYQFCYVSSDGRVRGASSPFQFSTAASHNQVEELELVEVSEDSLMVLQPKEAPVVTTENVGLEKELVSAKEKLESEKESLTAKLAMMQLETSQKVDELEEQVLDLQKQLQAKRESETRLMEKLEQKRATIHELTTARSNEEDQVTVLQHKLQESESTLAISQNALESSKIELAALAKQCEASEVRIARQNSEMSALQEMLAKQGVEMEQLQELQVDLMTQIGDKNKEFDELTVSYEELRRRYENETQTLRNEKEQLQQEATVAQQNVAELLGAKEEGVPLPPVNQHEPPTLPAANGHNTVDRSAYDALQQAYEDIEDQFYKCKEENKQWRLRFFDSKNKNAELEKRIKLCRVQYEAKCIELREFMKNRPVVGGSLTDVAALQSRLRDMEENQQQIMESFDVATKELATRKEELKQKTASINELTQKIVGLAQTNESVMNEFREFQDKHDAVVNDKAARLDQKEAVLQSKVVEIAELHQTIARLDKENKKLEATVKHHRDQLDTLKQQVHSSERSCPVCSTKFPGRISQQDFEKHVEGHFNNFQ